MAEPAPLVGRDGERRILFGRLDLDEPMSVVLAGAAGVGKTRLAREVLDLAANAGMATDWAVATEAASSIAFAALAHLLPSGPAGSRTELLHQAVEAASARAGGRRLVLGVDDAHLLDDASAALVHRLATTSGVSVLLTVRAGLVAPDAIVALWKDGVAERIELQPLTRADTDVLVESLVGGPVDGPTRHRIWESTTGNPLFVRELVIGAIESGVLDRRGPVTAWKHDAPPGARLIELVEGRLVRLTERARRALELLAVGEPLGRGELEHLGILDDVGDLEARGLADASRSENRLVVRVAHPLHGEVVRSRLPRLAFERTCRELADALDAVGGRRRGDTLRAASWRVESGTAADPDALTAAARQARTLFDHALSERLARAALAAGGGAEARIALSDAMYWLGRFEDAYGVLEGVNAVQAAVQRSSALFWGLGRYDDARAELRRATARTEDSAGRAELAAHEAAIALFGGDVAGAVTLALGVIGDPDAHDVAKIRAATAGAPALALAGRTEEALATAMAWVGPALERSDELPLAAGQLMALQGTAHWLAGRIDRTEAIAESLYGVAVTRRTDDARGPLATALGRAALTRGRVASAARWLREAESTLAEDDTTGFLPWVLGMLAQSLALLGDTDGARSAVARGEQAGHGAIKLFDIEIELGRAWIAANEGEVTRAVREARQAAEEAAATGNLSTAVLALHVAVRLGGATDVAGLVEDLTTRVDGAVAPVVAEHTRAVVAGDAKRLIECAEQFAELGHALVAAEIFATASRLLRAEGRRGPAAAATVRAEELLKECEGATTPALLLGLGGDDATDPRTALTARETEVALLAARGLSSRQIAERLVVSVRTVDNHLARVFGKLGVASRNELRPLFPDGRP